MKNMISKKIISQIEKEAKKYFKGAYNCHDWSHIERVKTLALHIGRKENARLDVLDVAVYLHDIGRNEEMKSKGAFCHAEKGAEIAKKILENYKIPKIDAENIVHSIQSHRYRNNHKPETLEAKVLYDADKLDAAGAVGVGRAFLFAGRVGAKLHNDFGTDIKNTKAYSREDTAYREFVVKLSKIKDKMLTKEGRRIANRRHSFMVKFFETLKREIQGKE
jgi:uncharacterized protein